MVLVAAGSACTVCSVRVVGGRRGTCVVIAATSTRNVQTAMMPCLLAAAGHANSDRGDPHI